MRQPDKTAMDAMGGAIMKSCRLGVALVLAAVVWASARAAEPCSLSVGWEPYGTRIYVDEAGAVAGSDIELMRTLAQDIGCAISFKQLPWTRHLLELQAGHIDVATSVRWTAEREGFGWFSDVYRHDEMALYVLRGTVGNHRLTGLAALPETGFKLGVIGGYYYGPEFEALMADPAFARQIEVASDYATNIRKLIHGRIDGILADDVTVVMAAAKTLGLHERLERHPLVVPGNASHLLFSKKSVAPALVAAINARLAAMKSDGRLQRIMDRYAN